MPDKTFSRTMEVNGSPDVSFQPAKVGHATHTTGKVAVVYGRTTPMSRDGVYLSPVMNKNRHKSLSPADGQGLLRETPMLEVIH